MGCGGRGCAFDVRHGCVRQNRVVLTPRCWRQVSRLRIDPIGSMRDIREATVTTSPARRGEHDISRKPLRRECRMPPLNLYARVRIFCAYCTRDRGCSVHPAFPAPLCPGNLSECANGRLRTNRPLLELSPLRPKATELVSERGTAPVSSSTRTVARASSPNRARKGVDDGTK
jgi:hypothetical protein